MENASKALIIAGAILLSILIIALGVFIFNIAKGAINTDQVDALSQSGFNNPITQFEGRQTGSSVKDLIQKLITNISTNKDSDEKLPDIAYLDTLTKGPTKALTGGNGGVRTIVSTVSNANANEMSSLMSSISNTHYYYIQTSTNVNTGLVDKVYICYSEEDLDKISTVSWR